MDAPPSQGLNQATLFFFYGLGGHLLSPMYADSIERDGVALALVSG